MRLTILLYCLLIVVFTGCNKTQEGTTKSTTEISPAQQLANQVLEANGGQKAWDEVHFLSWNFFGRRIHFWDKWTGDIRINSPEDSLVILMNINTGKGKVYKNRVDITTDSLLHKGKEWWINDSYWLIMPFKLTDPGTNLKLIGSDTTQAGDPAQVLELTFNNVGVTPENKYLIYVDEQTHRVSQWAYYPTVETDSPQFVLPWQDYRKYGQVWLSGDRGKAQLTDIEAFSILPKTLFTEP